jgi:hypothetical protein
MDLRDFVVASVVSNSNVARISESDSPAKRDVATKELRSQIIT